jgi:hypothetical protein
MSRADRHPIALRRHSRLCPPLKQNQISIRITRVKDMGGEDPTRAVAQDWARAVEREPVAKRLRHGALSPHLYRRQLLEREEGDIAR